MQHTACAGLGFVCVIFAFCGTLVAQNMEIIRKIPSFTCVVTPCTGSHHWFALVSLTSSYPLSTQSESIIKHDVLVTICLSSILHWSLQKLFDVKLIMSFSCFEYHAWIVSNLHKLMLATDLRPILTVFFYRDHNGATFVLMSEILIELELFIHHSSMWQSILTALSLYLPSALSPGDCWYWPTGILTIAMLA